MNKLIIACGFMFAAVVLAADETTTPASVAAPVAPLAQVAESVKLASKDWRNYKGCDDTCLSLCLENPTGYESKCSVLFSNNTLVNIPSMDTCKKAEIVQACSYQCQCACKRCGFCKQELVNACDEDKNPHECFDHVLDNIVTNGKCD
jgi:hypothetical protein